MVFFRFSSSSQVVLSREQNEVGSGREGEERTRGSKGEEKEDEEEGRSRGGTTVKSEKEVWGREDWKVPSLLKHLTCSPKGPSLTPRAHKCTMQEQRIVTLVQGVRAHNCNPSARL